MTSPHPSSTAPPRGSPITIPPEDVPLAMVITDIGKDLDDAMALSILGYCHALGGLFDAPMILSVIANLKTPLKRARTARALLGFVGCGDVPVGVGTDGTSEDHRERDYEYNPMMSAPPEDDNVLHNGMWLMKETLSVAARHGRKVKVVCLSSLRDIAMLCDQEDQLVKDTVEGFYIQGGAKLDGSNRVIPSEDAANNRFDMEAAVSFYSFLSREGISCTVSTKHSALASKIGPQFRSVLEGTSSPLSTYLIQQFKAQMMQFYMDSCGQNKYAPHMDKAWWIGNITTWNEKHPGVAAPEDESILDYVMAPAYDAIAVISTSDKWMAESGIRPTLVSKLEGSGKFRVIGASAQDTGVTAEGTATDTSNRILKYLLMACQFSHHH